LAGEEGRREELRVGGGRSSCGRRISGSAAERAPCGSLAGPEKTVAGLPQDGVGSSGGGFRRRQRRRTGVAAADSGVGSGGERESRRRIRALAAVANRSRSPFVAATKTRGKREGGGASRFHSGPTGFRVFSGLLLGQNRSTERPTGVLERFGVF
jgi:hypothetical protein